MKNATFNLLGLGLCLVLTACGGGDDSPRAMEQVTAENAADFVHGRVRDMTKTIQQAQAEGPPRLVSHRRLQGFLPLELTGRTHASFKSYERPNAGRSSAEGRYLVAATDPRRDIDLEISYFGTSVFNPIAILFGSLTGKRTKIAGFETFIEAANGATMIANNVYVRISDTLQVTASGSASIDALKDALATIDLKRLGRELDDETLFEPTEIDQLAQSILGLAVMADLLPAALGSIAINGVQQSREVEKEPFFACAAARYGNGRLALFDYGTLELTEGIERSAAKLGSLSMLKGDHGYEIESGHDELEHGDAYWTIATTGGNEQAMLGMRLFQGRFVAEYAAQFVPAHKGEVADHMQEYIADLIKQTGMGAFESPQAQLVAMREAFEAIDLESLNSEVAR